MGRLLRPARLLEIVEHAQACGGALVMIGRGPELLMRTDIKHREKLALCWVREAPRGEKELHV
jgi:hypothetical protein